MNILLSVITLIFVLSVVKLFENPVKPNYSIIKKSGNITYLWDLAATTPNAPSSKNWNYLKSKMEELGFGCTIKRVIPLSEALENNTGPIAEVLLARSRGCYSICAVFENDSLLAPAFYFVGETDILLVVFVLTKEDK